MTDPFSRSADLPPGWPRPCPDDCEAIDALVEAGFDVARVAPAMRARAERVAALLSGLESPPAGRTDLLASTMARIAAATDVGASASSRGWISEESALAPLEQDSLDALVAAGYDADRVSSALQASARGQASLLNHLATPLADEAGPDWAANRERRIARTLAALEADARDQRTRMSISPASTRWSGMRKWDVLGAAAAVAIGASLLWPMLGGMRDSMRQTACLGNFQAAGIGFTQYANDYRGSMPMASASLPGGAWWMVGKDPSRSNSANLFTLARAHYSGLETLRCSDACDSPVGQPAPGQMDWKNLDQVSLSGQNLFSSYRPSMLSGTRMVVLADRSPLILRAVRQGPGSRINAQDPLANSPNHKGRGQNVLWTDGSGEWLTSPVLPSGGLGAGDNLWLPLTFELVLKQAARFQGTARGGEGGGGGGRVGVVILRGVDDLEPGNTFLVP
jgi:hypothetical protein